MFARFLARLQLRRTTAFLLSRRDDHLLRDIGLTRDDVLSLHLGVPPAKVAVLCKPIPLPA